MQDLIVGDVNTDINLRKLSSRLGGGLSVVESRLSSLEAQADDYVKKDGSVAQVLASMSYQSTAPGSSSDIGKIYSMIDGHLYYKDANGFVYKLTHAQNTFCTQADVINVTTTQAYVTGISFYATASKLYHFFINLMAVTSVSTNGCIFRFTGPSSPTLFRAYHSYTNSGGTFTEEEISGFSVETGATSQSTSIYSHRFDCTLINGSNSGMVYLQFRNEVASTTMTIKQGGICQVIYLGSV